MVIVIAGAARVRPGQEEKAVEAARVMARASRAEPGCRTYAFSVDIDDERTFRIVEEWESEEALAAHFAAPHMAEFGKVLGEVLDGAPDFRRYVVAEVGPLTG